MNKCRTLFIIVIFILFSSSDSFHENPENNFSPEKASSSGNSSWLVMLYQDADDYQLEQDIFTDLNEAELIGSSDSVHIVSQLDRYDGGFDGDGDWHGTRRFYLEQDSDITAINSPSIDVGEVSMSSGQSLVDFALWAMNEYPADRYAIILSDHGSGWPGGWTDPNPDWSDSLTMKEMAQAFKTICNSADIEKLDLVGFDACLMGHMEVFAEISPFARYAVGSQETEPGIGWAYSGFLGALVEHPEMDGAELARSIVDSYIVEDSTVKEWRNEEDVEYSSDEIMDFMGGNTTLSAIDLEVLKQVDKSLDYFVGELQLEDPNIIAKARTYAKSYTNIFDESQPSPYIDLYHFASLVGKETSSRKIRGAANLLMKAVDQAVVHEKHGHIMKGSHGISIYFPNSLIYSNEWGGPENYSSSVPYFAKISQWDEFLRYHYSGKEFDSAEKPVYQNESNDETELVEESISPVDFVVPGKGEIEISGTSIDSDVITLSDIPLLNAVIKGNNIANIYLFVGYYDPDSDSILVADKDYIEADDTRVVDGVHYPDWTDWKDFELEFEWEPILFSLVDDNSEVFCLLEPVEYGATADDAVYMVEGEYTSRDGRDTRYAQMYFNGKGYIESLFGFSGENYSAPHEITPRDGDQFTVYETWYGPDENGEYAWVQEYGGTVTFGEAGVEWYDTDAYIGEYIIGFIVEDFDGNMVEEYVDLYITE